MFLLKCHDVAKLGLKHFFSNDFITQYYKVYDFVIRHTCFTGYRLMMFRIILLVVHSPFTPNMFSSAAFILNCLSAFLMSIFIVGSSGGSPVSSFVYICMFSMYM